MGGRARGGDRDLRSAVENDQSKQSQGAEVGQSGPGHRGKSDVPTGLNSIQLLWNVAQPNHAEILGILACYGSVLRMVW